MKKIVAIIGGIIGLAGIIASLFDQTLGWWEITSVVEILGSSTTYKTFLSPFGNLSYDYKDDIISIEGSIMILIALTTIIGNVLLLVGAFTDKNVLVIIGTFLAIIGLTYFLYSIGNFEEITALIQDESLSVIFGSESYTFIATTTSNWRLGNGYFVTAAGAMVSLVGSFLKE